MPESQRRNVGDAGIASQTGMTEECVIPAAAKRNAGISKKKCKRCRYCSANRHDRGKSEIIKSFRFPLASQVWRCWKGYRNLKNNIKAEMSYYVYILTNINNKVLYIGVTNNLKRRIYEHKEKIIDGFTKTYNCNKLVWFQETNSIEEAIRQEKRMKKWKREYKENMINGLNPYWDDLYEQL